MAETVCCQDMSSHKDDLMSLVKEFRTTVGGVKLMHTLLVNVTAHLAPNIRAINEAADTADLADTVSDIQLIYSLVANLTQHMGGKLESFNRKIEAFEEKIRELGCGEKLVNVTLQEPEQGSVHLNDVAASSVSLAVHNVEDTTLDGELRSLDNVVETEESFSIAQTLNTQFLGNPSSQSMTTTISHVGDDTKEVSSDVLSSEAATNPKEINSEVTASVDDKKSSNKTSIKDIPTSAEGTPSTEPNTSSSKGKISFSRRGNERKRNLSKSALPIALVGPRVASVPSCNDRQQSSRPSYATAVGMAESTTDSWMTAEIESHVRRNGMLITRTNRSQRHRVIQSMYSPTSTIQRRDFHNGQPN